MRLKAYTAATVSEAMQQIREELGGEAIIVSTETNGGAVRVVAAVDEAELPQPPRPAGARPVAWPTLAETRSSRLSRDEKSSATTPKGNGATVLARALANHGVPEPIRASLTEDAPAGPSPAAALAEWMQKVLRFANLADRREMSPILLAGPPGAGKTLVAAKLAAKSVLNGQSVRVITTDIGSAGAVEQLAAFTRPLQLDLETADGPAALARLVSQRTVAPRPLIVIDTGGVNPFDAVEMAGLSALIVASRAEATLVLGAGGDAQDCAEMAESFADIGCGRLVATRLDIARRFGGILAAAMAGRLALAETGASPIVAHGLRPLNPHLLARLFVTNSSHLESNS